MPTTRALVVPTVVAALVTCGVFIPGATAQARNGGGPDRVTTTSSCGPIATKLALRARDGGNQAEFELDQNRNGRTWKLTMTRNGTVVARGKRTTHAPSGSFTWRVTTAGGTDPIQVTARRGSTTCTIQARISSPGEPNVSPSPASATPSATGAGSGSSPTDTIEVTKCYTNATATTGGELLIKASSSDPTARLFAYRPDGSLIGEVQNGGGSRYGGSVMPYQAHDPGTVTVTSSSGGSITVKTGPFQL